MMMMSSLSSRSQKKKKLVRINKEQNHLPRGYCQALSLSLVVNDNKKKAHPSTQSHARGVFKYKTTPPCLAFEGEGGGQEVTDDNDDDRCRRRRLKVKRKRN